MKRFTNMILSAGSCLCSFAVLLTTLLTPGCRFSWYQPKEPENLENLLRGKG